MIKLFTAPGCPKCGPAKEHAEKLTKAGLEVECYDVSTTDGMAEAAYYNVMTTPTFVITDEHGNELNTLTSGLWEKQP